MYKQKQTLDKPNEKLKNQTKNDIKKLENYIDSLANQQDQQQYLVLHGKTNVAEVNQNFFMKEWFLS